MNIKIFGDRVLFEPVNEEVTGSILLPQTEHRTYELGRVLEVGDGKVKTADGGHRKVPILVQPTDIIWFQVNPQMAYNNAARIGGKTYMTIMQHDMIARLKSCSVTLKNFEILGYWTLLETFEDRVADSMIVLPDTVSDDTKALRYRIKQKGSLVEDVSVGQEVIIERRSANPVDINGERFFYLDSRKIFGVVSK